MICSVLLFKQLDELREQIPSSNRAINDLVEFRLDRLEKIDFAELTNILSLVDKPYILSLRSEWLNQEIKSPEIGRIPILKGMVELEPPYISLEYPLDMHFLPKVSNRTIPIITFVDFEGIAKIPFDLIENIMIQNKRAILKISCTPNTVMDIMTLHRTAKMCIRRNINHIILGMGIMGRITRLKSKEWDNMWTYGRANTTYEEPKLPGMLPVERIRRGIKITSKHFLGMSFVDNFQVELIMDKFFLRYKKEFTFLNMDVRSTSEIDQLLIWVKDELIDGLYIDREGQKDIVDRLERADTSVINTGKCNMITKKDGEIYGYNTMVYGIKRKLDALNLRYHRVYIEGDSIEVITFISALKYMDLEEIIIRTDNIDTILELKKLDKRVISFTESINHDYDIIINCDIPHKGFESVLPLSSSKILPAKLIIDPLSTETNPTPLQTFAKNNNIATINGWDIFKSTFEVITSLWIGETHEFQLKMDEVIIEPLVDVYQFFVDNS